MKLESTKPKGTLAMRNTKSIPILIGIAVLAAASPVRGEDWPTYMKDNYRGGVSSEQFDPNTLALKWVYTPANPPQRAWSDTAPRDFYANRNLPDDSDFDRVFYCTVVGNDVFFGSSADDAAFCLDAATGQVKWMFFTEGPVRMAPTVVGGKVYVGSDDGHVYCLDQTTGALIWNYLVPASSYRVPNNGKFVSLWPVRGGVLIDGGIAYATAGFSPTEGAFVCALDAATGSDTGPDLWRVSTAGTALSSQGYIMASSLYLFIPSADTPFKVRRSDGQYMGQFLGGGGHSSRGGGTYALMSDTLDVISGPNRTDKVVVHDGDTAAKLAQFNGNHMLITPTTTYLQSDILLSSMNRVAYRTATFQASKLSNHKEEIDGYIKTLDPLDDSEYCRVLHKQSVEVERELEAARQAMLKAFEWTAPCLHRYCLIKAGNLLFAGGDNEAAAYSDADGSIVWTGAVIGKAHGITAANGQLYVSTDRGYIYAFSAGGVGQDSLDVVWVDFPWSGPEVGSVTHPFNSLAEGASAVATGGTIRIKPGSTSETIVLSKPMRIEAVGGSVRAGG